MLSENDKLKELARLYFRAKNSRDYFLSEQNNYSDAAYHDAKSHGLKEALKIYAYAPDSLEEWLDEMEREL